MTLPRKNMCMGKLQLGCRGRSSSVHPFTVWFYLWMTARIFVVSDISRKSRNWSSVFCVDKTYPGCGRYIGRRLNIKSKIFMLSWKEIWWKFQIYFHFFSIALFSSFSSSAFASGFIFPPPRLPSLFHHFSPLQTSPFFSDNMMCAFNFMKKPNSFPWVFVNYSNQFRIVEIKWHQQQYAFDIACLPRPVLACLSICES